MRFVFDSNNITRIYIWLEVKIENSVLKIKVSENSFAEVNLLNSEDGIAPGQACVFYNKDKFGHRVLGGGWIKE